MKSYDPIIPYDSGRDKMDVSDKSIERRVRPGSLQLSPTGHDKIFFTKLKTRTGAAGPVSLWPEKEMARHTHHIVDRYLGGSLAAGVCVVGIAPQHCRPTRVAAVGVAARLG